MPEQFPGIEKSLNFFRTMHDSRLIPLRCMPKRIIQADRIFSGTGETWEGEKNRAIVIDETGVILDLIPVGSAEAEVFEGSICPGFVNAHGHLELAHLKGAIGRHTTLIPFLDGVNKLRAFPEEEKQAAIARAEVQMWQAGVSACGDISNSLDSLAVKRASSIRFHTFIEIFGVSDARTRAAIERAEPIQQAYREAGLSAGLSPHAPYSARTLLLRELSARARAGSYPISIHMQETQAEQKLFTEADPSFPDFFKSMGIDDTEEVPVGPNPLDYVMASVSGSEVCQLMLVHNTLTTSADMHTALNSQGVDPWWCLCPRANLYIENQLPDFSLFQKYSDRVLVGTDSLASNDDLNPLNELIAIREAAPTIDPGLLISWACGNGACFFGWDDLGQIEKGRKPGLVLISRSEGGSPLGPGSLSRRLA